MIKLYMDSRFMNAAIYVMIDVFCYSVISFELKKLQTYITKYRLRRGQHVKLRESKLSLVAGGALADGSTLFPILVVSHVLVLVLLFCLTLGVSGSSSTVLRTTTRAYVTRLASGRLEDVVRSRLNPKIFSGCFERKESSLRYYPTAFNLEEDIEITDFYTFTGSNSKVASVDGNSMLCQKYHNTAPLLNVIRCGETDIQCSNLYVSEPFSIVLRKDSLTEVDTFGGGYGHLGLYMNVKVDETHDWSAEYNRLICIEEPRIGNSKTPMATHFNCVLGKWGERDTVFKFRLGKALLPYSTMMKENLLNKNITSTFAFRASSQEIVLSWDRKKKGEWIFIQAYRPIGIDFADARSYLDSMISRTVIAEKADGLKIFREEQVLVTEVEMFSVVGYIALFGLSTVLIITRLFNGRTVSRFLGVENIYIDITTFQGLLTVSQRSFDGWITASSKAAASFGIVKDEVNDTFTIGFVQEGDQNISLSWKTPIGYRPVKENSTKESLGADSINESQKELNTASL